MKKRILILGNTAKAYALGKILHKDGHEIYALSGNDGMKEFLRFFLLTKRVIKSCQIKLIAKNCCTG